MKFTQTDNIEEIKELRIQLYQNLTAPIDAMWELLYIAHSTHFLIENESKIIGFCAVDDAKSLVQFFIKPQYNHIINNAIISLIQLEIIKSAKLSSNEPLAFNACLNLSKSINTNTYCFQYSNSDTKTTSTLKLDLVTLQDIPVIKSFLKEQVGMDDTFGYTENLVERKEIYMLKDADAIIATSECRRSDTQLNIVDLGVIVNKLYQGKGIATQILIWQANRVLNSKRKPICSTTVDNIASKKAIEKAGFYSSNIIFDINF